MLQLENASGLPASLAVFPDPQGIDTLYTVVKATFALRPRLALADVQLPVSAVDAWRGEPGKSSLTEVSEFHLGKPGTDVLLTGHAVAPQGRPAPQSAVRLVVANRQKTAAIFGKRVWRRGGTLSPPEPFEKVPLVWEHAYGGCHEVTPGGALLGEDANPLGVGFVGRRAAESFIGTQAPQIEDPVALMQALGDRPPPVGFGPMPAAWAARRRFAGTYDAAWQRTRAPYLPADFDPRFFHVAPAPFAFAHPLQGGEPVSVIGVSYDGPYAFAVPRLVVGVNVMLGRRQQSVKAVLETLWIHADTARVSLSYRAALACDKEVLAVKQVRIEVAGLEDEGLAA